MNKTIDQMLNRPRIALIFIAFVSLCALSFAYMSEYFFGLQPCVLCIYQRVPFFIVLMIGFFGFVIHQNRICLLALGLSALAFFVNTGIAVFHSGVERKMWEGTDACGGADISTMTSLADLKASILAAPVSRCDEMPWDFLGLSMANYNVIFCFILGIYCLIALRNGLKNDTE